MNHSALRTPHSAFIKVLLVDDSPIALKIIERILSRSPDIRVVGVARNGKEAFGLIPEVNPDVICTDLHMPVMDGLQFTKEVMEKYPRPILVLSVSVQTGSLNVFRLLEAGAVDVFPKPRSTLSSDYEMISKELIQKIKVLAGVVAFSKRPKPAHTENSPCAAMFHFEESAPVSVVVIGASTGGPQALQTILGQLPADFPVPIICVQHIGNDFSDGLVDWLSSQCKLKIRHAHTGLFPAPGVVYFPEKNTHLKISKRGNFISANEPLFDGHCPSVSVTMQSAADYYGNAAMGILLTGMGKDGAEGMRAISSAGGITIVQDEESCVVFGMPKAAIELGAAKYVLPLPDIAGMLLQLQKARGIKL